MYGCPTGSYVLLCTNRTQTPRAFINHPRIDVYTVPVRYICVRGLEYRFGKATAEEAYRYSAVGT